MRALNLKRGISIIALSIVFIGLSNSCTADPASLIVGVWDFEDMTTTSEDETILGFVALGKALMVDGTQEFQEDGTIITTSPLADDDTGSWELIGDDQLIIENDLGTSTANIDVLTKKELKYIEVFTLVGSTDTYTVTTSWTRQ